MRIQNLYYKLGGEKGGFLQTKWSGYIQKKTVNIIRKTKKPFWKNENGKSGLEEGKTKTESSPTRTKKKTAFERQ